MKPQLDLPPKTLNLLKQLISEHLGDVEVWAYGSRVKQQNHEGSDLDLVVVSDNVTWSDVLAFREVLRDSNIPIFVDVMDWNVIPESFKQEIQSCHVPIYP